MDIINSQDPASSSVFIGVQGKNQSLVKKEDVDYKSISVITRSNPPRSPPTLEGPILDQASFSTSTKRVNGILSLRNSEPAVQPAMQPEVHLIKRKSYGSTHWKPDAPLTAGSGFTRLGSLNSAFEPSRQKQLGKVPHVEQFMHRLPPSASPMQSGLTTQVSTTLLVDALRTSVPPTPILPRHEPSFMCNPCMNSRADTSTAKALPMNPTMSPLHIPFATNVSSSHSNCQSTLQHSFHTAGPKTTRQPPHLYFPPVKERAGKGSSSAPAATVQPDISLHTASAALSVFPVRQTQQVGSFGDLRRREEVLAPSTMSPPRYAYCAAI